MKAYDTLGIGSRTWNVAATVRFFSQLKEPAGIGAFYKGWPHAFGNPLPAIQKVIKTGNCSAVRIHLWWSAGTHAMGPADAIKRGAVEVNAFAKKNPGVKFYLSPTCEYKERSLAVIKNRIDIIKRYAPLCIPVLSPWQSPVLPGLIVEKHGVGCKTKAGQIASYDGGGKKGQGFDEEQSAESWMDDNHSADLVYSWSPIFNCSESHNELPPDGRPASPGYKYYKALERLMEPKGLAPATDLPFKPLKAPYLYKLFAEDMQGSNDRDNLPLFICKGKSRSIVAVDRLGNALGRFTVMGFDKPGAYPGGLTRYYSGGPGGVGLYGWELAAKAKASSGSEFIGFKSEEGLLGLFNGAFRTPFYQ